MKIMHVVTLVTPDGSFGGPLRVAVNQVRALRARGHQVDLVAGAQGFEGPLPLEYDGVPVTLFPARQAVPGTGFAGLVAPRLTAFVARRAREYDVVHLHLARDLVALPTALAAAARRVPLVVHTHGMIDASDRLLAKPLDLAMTRPVMRSAAGSIALVPREKTDLQELFPQLVEPVVLPNGVPPTVERAVEQRAGAAAEHPEVLFLARVAARKRPVEFVRAAQLLAPEFPAARFTLIGPDEDRGDAVRTAIAEDDADGRIVWEGPLAPDRTAARMAAAAVYVLPAVDEPFGMTLIEAMAVGLPTVANHDCGLAEDVRATGGAVAHDDSVESLASAVRELLTDPERRRRAGAAGLEHVEHTYSMDAVARRLETIYVDAIGRSEP